MKIKFGLVLAATLSTAVMAQVPNNPQPAPPVLTPPPTIAVPTTPTNAIKAESAPEATLTNATPSTTTNAVPKTKKSSKKKSTKSTAKKPAKKESVKGTNAPSSIFGEPLVVNEPATALGNNVNIRGQAHVNSEVVGHLKRGEVVTVLEIVTLPHPKTDEPARWAKITLPESIHVWLNNSYLTNDTVSVKKLNLRTGPGENYSVAGMLHKGDVVKPGTKKGDWVQIEAPTNAFGFVAAHLLTHKESAPIAATPAPAPTTETVVTAAPPLATGANELPAPTNAAPVAPVPTPLPAADEPPPRRIIEREGIVGGTASIQAPTHYQLYSLDDGHVMDYLFSNTTNLMVGKYKGMTVLVTGEEELDERWPNTPVITIQKIQVIK